MEIEKRLNKTGTKYQVKAWDNRLGKKVYVGTFRTKREAEAAGQAYEMELRTEGFVKEVKDITFGDLCDRYLENNTQLQGTTRSWYRVALKPARTFFGDNASVRRMTREAVQKYVTSLDGEGKAAKTVCGYMKALGAVMEQAVEWDYRDDNPAHKVRNLPANRRRDDAIRVITPQEHQKLVEAAEPAYRVMVSIWPFVGLRRSEMQGLTWDCVDLAAATLEVRFQLREDGTLDSTLKTPKSARTVHLTARVVRELREWKLASPPNAMDLVFPTPRGLPQRSSAQFYKVWKRICEAAGLEGLDPHDMRHCFATWSLEAGENVKRVADQMGHEKPSITLDTYAHLLTDAAPRAVHQVEEWYDTHPVAGGQEDGTAAIPPLEATGTS